MPITTRIITRKRRRVSLAMALAWAVTSHAATPDAPVLFEQEPNNSPKQAASITGPVRLYGDLPAGDQDIFLWEVSDTDALRPWTLTLEGLPGALTSAQILRLHWSDNGQNVTQVEKLYELSVKNSPRPAYSPPLWLEPGQYFLGVARAGGSSASAETASESPQNRYRLFLDAGRPTRPQNATNNTADKPFVLGLNTFQSHYASRPDTWVRLNVTPEQASKTFAIHGSTVLGTSLTATLYDAQKQPLATAKTDQAGHFLLSKLQLPAGSYLLKLHGTHLPAIHLLKTEITGVPIAGKETEPNHIPQLANVIKATDEGFTIKGQIDQDYDHDLYRLLMPEGSADERWQLRLETPPGQSFSMCLKNAQGTDLQCKYRIKSPLLPDLFLPDKAYLVEVKDGQPGTAYQLSLSGQSEGKKQWETEPNDTWQIANTMGPKNLIKAALTGPDTDTFRFDVPEPGYHWRVQVMGAGIESLAVLDGSGQTLQSARGSQNSRQLRLNRLTLKAGTHYVQIKGRGQSTGSYRVRVLSTGRIDPAGESEPNDSQILALPLVWHQARKSTLNAPSDKDFYHFRLGNEEKIDLQVKPELPLKQATVRITGPDLNKALKPDQNGLYSFNEILPAAKYTLEVVAYNLPAPIDYAVRLQRLPFFPQKPSIANSHCHPHKTDPGPQEKAGTGSKADTGRDCPPLPALPVTASLMLEQSSIAAFQPYGQKLTGQLRLKNESATPVQAHLDFALSERRWKVRKAPKAVDLPAGHSQTIPFQVVIPADVPAQNQVRITAQVSAKAHAPVQAHTDITVSPKASVRHPYWDWGIPLKLLGGFNVAASQFGARVLATDKKLLKQNQQLIDGIAEPGTGLRLPSPKSLPYAVTVELAGDEPVPVAGVVLDTRGKTAAPNFPHKFSVELSQDGQQFTPVLTGELSGDAQPHGFALQKPVPARFARLRLLSAQPEIAATGHPLSLGEFKVISTPGWDMAHGQGVNLANPNHGGFVAWSRPSISAKRDQALLTPERDMRSVLVPTGKNTEWVIGFKNTRTALIAGLQGTAATKAGNAKPLNRFEVFVSQHSPVGPWQAVGQWDMQAKPSIRFEKPIWARYVRFLARTDSSNTGKFQYVMPPETIAIFEQPVGKGYRSITGEWGLGEEKAIFERVHGITLPEPKGSRANAIQTLKPRQLVTGQVQLGQTTARYRIQVPEGKNTLLIGLKGDPTVRTVLAVSDEQGQPLPLRRENQGLTVQQFSTRVKPGQPVNIEVKEPPRSVAFVWDDSGSMAEYRHSIYDAITTYARNVRPGMDEANLLVFGGDYLLKKWTGSSRELLTALNEYPRNRNSSQAERALKKAIRGLADRDGTRAIILITDAEFSRDNDTADLWEGFAQVRPRIFALHVGGNTGIPRQLMRLWPSINNGHLAIINNTDDMDLAFERAKVRLRQPARFALQADFDQREDPGPAQLVVLPGENKSTAGAVELILDASGSMLQRLGGKRRIDIAKAVLSQAIDSLPEKTTVALRVFGHRTPNACETHLVSPPAPLNKDNIKRHIAAITAKNLARTPIADSLAQVVTDLKGVRGKKAVVLVTDGEETCDGDPAKVLRALQDQGFALRLNIVGFAIDDKALKEQFTHWASLTGGQYFDAASSKELGQSVNDALRTPYTVFNAHGEQVAKGTVGGKPVSLPEGVYRMKVDSEPARVFDQVALTGGQLKKLRL